MEGKPESEATEGPAGVVPVGWAAGAGPLYRQLAEAIGTGIRRGDLAGGTMLPPERELASALSVSRATVARAYAELRARRLVDGRQGRGTWVVAGAEPRPPAEHIAPLLADHTQLVDLALAVPPPRRIDVESTPRGRDVARVDRLVGGSGLEPLGLPELREALAGHFSARGLSTTPDQVLVTSGAQHALSLVFAELVSPGAAVVVEESTYPGALDLARSVGARLLAVPTDARGVDVDALEDLVARHRPALVYLNPVHQTPTGTVLSDDRRRRLAALAMRTGTPVVDDATLADLSFSDAPPPPIAVADRRAPVLTIGSLSKVGWAGLRVGWVRADRSLVDRLAARRMLDDLGGSLPAQLLALDLVATLSERAAIRARELRVRHDHLLDLLGRYLPDWEVAPAAGGTVLWARLPRGHDAVAFQAVAEAQGVSVVAGPSVSVPGSSADRVRLSFVAEPALLEVGVARLAAAWDESVGAVRRAGRRPLV